MNGRRAHAQHRMVPGRRAPEAGESLIEVLATITIVAISVVGLVAALGMNFVFGSGNRAGVNGHALLVRYAEALAGESYADCTAGSPYAAEAVADIPATDLPAGVTAAPPASAGTGRGDFALAIDTIGYWNRDRASATFTATCGSSDPGLQQLVLSVRAGDGSFTELLTIYKRRP